MISLDTSGQIVSREGCCPISFKGGTSSSVLSGLAHYWPLDESSGTRTDAVGGVTLTDVNTVGSTAGIHNLAGSFVKASIERLTGTGVSGAATAPGTMSASVWIYPLTSAGDEVILCHGNILSEITTRTWQIYRNATTLHFSVYNASGTATDATNTVTQDVWQLVVVWLDTDGKPRVSVNDGAAGVSASALASYRSASTGITIGSIGGSAAYGGAVDEVAVWTRVLTSTERTTLYNGGAGKFYPTF